MEHKLKLLIICTILPILSFCQPAHDTTDILGDFFQTNGTQILAGGVKFSSGFYVNPNIDSFLLITLDEEGNIWWHDHSEWLEISTGGGGGNTYFAGNGISLSSFIFSLNYAFAGTFTNATWHGVAIADAFISSASTWNSKQSALTFGTGLTNTAGTVTLTNSSLSVNGVSISLGGSGSVTDAILGFSDISTNNSSTSNHGFLKKLTGTSTQYMDGNGNWSTPSGTTYTAGVGLGGVTTFSVSTTQNILNLSGLSTNGLVFVNGGNGTLNSLADNTTSTKKFLSETSSTISWGVLSSGDIPALSYLTNFSSGNLSPLFTTTVGTSTSTPSLSFSLSTSSAHTFFGNFTGSTAVPSYSSPSLASADFLNQGTTTTLLHGNAAGNPSWSQVSMTTDITGVNPVANGGTNKSSAVLYDILYATSATAYGAISIGSANQFLRVNSGATGYVWGSLVSGDIPNNAANTTGSASTLTTLRTIFGENFNGSANVTGIAYTSGESMIGSTSGTLNIIPASTITSYIWIPPSSIAASTGYSLQVSSISSNTMTTQWVASSGGGTPAGSNTQVQINNSGSFGATSNFTYNISNDQFNIGSSSGNGFVNVGGFVMTIKAANVLHINTSSMIFDNSSSNNQIYYCNSGGQFSQNSSFTFDGNTFGVNHIKGTTSAPTIAAGVGAGSSPPTPTINGTDVGGYISLTTGTIPTGSATVATITFNQAYASSPRCIILSGANSTTSALSGVTMVCVPQGSITTTTFIITSGATGLAAATAYQWYYYIIQ